MPVRPVRISPLQVSGITLSETSLSLGVGETQTLTPTVLPNRASDKSVTWKSSNPAVATVSADGLMTAVSEGSCTITCTAADGSGVSATCEVEVYPE